MNSNFSSLYPVNNVNKLLMGGDIINIRPKKATIIPDTINSSSFTIIRSISYYSLNKSFNIKSFETYNMTFKLKAWMVYLIGVAVIPILFTAYFWGNGIAEREILFEFYFIALFPVVFFGAIGLLIYYAISKRFKKKEQGTK